MRAVGLLSGGLDSTLAAKLMLEQGIQVHAVNFRSPFCTCTPKKASCSSVMTAIRQLGDIPLESIVLGDEYLDMVRNPKHGYGRGLNPCIDCRIMKIRKAMDFMRSIDARFIFTGEVVGQRPMSQHRNTLAMIDKEAGVRGLLLRPLSAQLLPPTVAEENGWVDRTRLLAIKGRGRKDQIRLAGEYGVEDFRCGGGGCLLTDKNFADRLRDCFAHNPSASVKDMALLKVGRHFRLSSGDKLVVAHNAEEGEALARLARAEDWLFLPEGFSGPVVVLQGSDREAALERLLSYIKHDIPAPARLLVRHGGGETGVPLPDWKAWAARESAPAAAL